MALYDFQCAACGVVFEIERPLGFTGKVKCTSCGSLRTTKMFSAAGIVFKGSGFYVTDSKKSGSDPSGTAGRSGVPIDKGSGSGSESSDSGSSDSKGGSDGSSSEAKGSDKGKETASKQPDSPAA